MVLGTGFLLLVSMVLSTALSALSGVMGTAFGMSPAIAHVLHLTVSFVVITLLFAMIFKVLPDATVKWGDVWIGAIFTAALFTLGKFLLGFYLGRASTASAYGAAGSLVIVLMWVYYSSIILFFGAEFTQVFAKERGSRVVPKQNAIAITEEARRGRHCSRCRGSSGRQGQAPAATARQDASPRNGTRDFRAYRQRSTRLETHPKRLGSDSGEAVALPQRRCRSGRSYRLAIQRRVARPAQISPALLEQPGKQTMIPAGRASVPASPNYSTRQVSAFRQPLLYAHLAFS